MRQRIRILGLSAFLFSPLPSSAVEYNEAFSQECRGMVESSVGALPSFLSDLLNQTPLRFERISRTEAGARQGHRVPATWGFNGPVIHTIEEDCDPDLLSRQIGHAAYFILKVRYSALASGWDELWSRIEDKYQRSYGEPIGFAGRPAHSLGGYDVSPASGFSYAVSLLINPPEDLAERERNSDFATKLGFVSELKAD